MTLFNASTTPYNQTLSGYYILLNQNLQKNSTSDYSGEKVVNAPTTVGGFTFFGTNQPTAPSDAACTPNLGTARGYKINFLTASGGFTEFSGGGLPPSPVYGIVNVTTSSGQDIQLPFLLGGGGGALDGTVGGGQLETCSGPDCRSPLGGQKPPIPVPPQKKRLYWYRSVDR